jgi:hypothetical protein
MTPRRRLPAELRLLGQQLLADQSGELDVENLEAVARLLGVKLVQCDDRRPTMRREAPLPDDEKTPEELTKLYEDQLLELNARKLGLRLR